MKSADSEVNYAVCDFIASFYQLAFVQVNYMVDDKLKYLTFQ